MSDEKNETRKPAYFAAVRLRGQIERERLVEEAEATAQRSLAGCRRALGELLASCGQVEEARARLAEAEAAVTRVNDPGQKARLEERLAKIRRTLEESEQVCKGRTGQ
jgi:hypothetical protein